MFGYLCRMDNGDLRKADLLGDASFRADRAAALLGFIIGFTPVLAGIVFRTYTYDVAPPALEILRQLDLPFILVEVGVIIWARSRGLRPATLIALLDRHTKWAVAIFVCSFWVSSAFVSEQPGYSMFRASFWPVHAIFCLAVFHLARGVTPRGLTWFAIGLCTGLLAYIPLLAWHFLRAPDPAGVPGGIIWSSAVPGCLSVRHLGIWSALVLVCATGLLYTNPRHIWQRIFLFAVIFVATATLFWSGTRAGVYGAAGAVFLVLVTVRRTPPIGSIALAILAAGLGVALSELWLPPDPAFGFFAGRDNLPDADLDAFSNGRTILWTAMLQAFASRPIFGLGEGAILWLVTLPSGQHHVQPHNAIVQMLSSWGLIASTAFAYLMSRFLIKVHGIARTDQGLMAAVAMIDCLLIMSMADGVLYFSRFVMWFAGAAGLALAYRGYGSCNAAEPIRRDLVAA